MPAGSARDTLVIRKIISAPREVVFAAWLDPDSIRRWMCPGQIQEAEAHIEPRVGGAFRIIMKDQTRSIEHTGEYRVIEPPSRLVFTWISRSTESLPTLVTVEFLERDGQCELVLTHERLPSPEALRLHEGGWKQIVDKLAEHLRQTRTGRDVMADMQHEISIAASPEKVYQAITTPEGLRGWWTADSAADARVGSVAEFGFYNRATVFRMRIEELTPGKRVVWSCLGNDDQWKGTRLTWDIVPDKDGETTLHFVHGGWRATTGYFASCNSTWGALMYRLKDYVEGKRPGPMWTK